MKDYIFKILVNFVSYMYDHHAVTSTAKLPRRLCYILNWLSEDYTSLIFAKQGSHFYQLISNKYFIVIQPGVQIGRALGPMASKIACGPSKLTLCGPAGPENLRRH